MNKMKNLAFLFLIFAMCFVVGCSRQGGTPPDEGDPSRPALTPAKPLTENEARVKIQDSLNYLVIGLGDNWVADVSSPMYRSVNTAVFRRILEVQYEKDSGTKFDYANIEGNRDIYIKTAAKHFPLSEEDALGIFRRRKVYNRETNTIIPSDGLGCVADRQLIKWEYTDENIISADYSYTIPDKGDEYLTLKGALVIRVDPMNNSFKFLSNKLEPMPHTIYRDLSFLPEGAKEFFDSNRDKALAFSQSGGTFIYGRNKAFDLRKDNASVEVDGRNYLVTTTDYEAGVEFLESIYHKDIAGNMRWDGKYTEIDGKMAFIDRDSPYSGRENMSGYRVFTNNDMYITFTRQIYTHPDTGLFTGINYEMVNTENGWRFYRAEYILE